MIITVRRLFLRRVIRRLDGLVTQLIQNQGNSIPDLNIELYPSAFFSPLPRTRFTSKFVDFSDLKISLTILYHNFKFLNFAALGFSADAHMGAGTSPPETTYFSDPSNQNCPVGFSHPRNGNPHTVATWLADPDQSGRVPSWHLGPGDQP